MSHQEKLERAEPWPDDDRFARAWDAANGMRVPGAPLDEVAQRIAFECIERIEAIHAGDRTTARTLMEASQVITEMMREIRRLRKEAARWQRDYKATEKDHVDMVARYCAAEKLIERLGAELASYTGNGRLDTQDATEAP